MRVILAAVAFALSVPAVAQHAPSPAGVNAAVAERALKLATILNSEAIIVGNGNDEQQLLEMVGALVGSAEKITQMEKEMPGVTRALALELNPILTRSSRERLPELQRRQAALYAAHFTAAELDKLIEFYTSPTGAKLIATMQAHIKPTAVIAEAVKSDDFTFGAQSALKDIRATVPAITQAMDDTDKAALVSLAQSAAAPKLRALAPLTQQIALDWMNEEAPWEAEETEKAINRVMARFGEGKWE